MANILIVYYSRKSERDLKALCKGATVRAGLSVHGAESESKVAAWAKKSV